MRVMIIALGLMFVNVLTSIAQPDRVYRAESSYVVIINSSTYAKDEWRKAAELLRKRYDADLIVCEKSVRDALPDLKRIFPNYACFVLEPEDAGRDTIVQIHRMLRKLDDDPYTDLIWGVLTGYNAADAMRIAKYSKPLIVKSGASSMGAGILSRLESGFASNENSASDFWIKKAGGSTEKMNVRPDAISFMVDAFNNGAADMFVTSGHATEKDWQVGYNIRAGQFRCKDGQLYGLSTNNRRYDINSTNPKIYLPKGNCLIGRIPGRDCMATAWMHTGGVNQMFGYTAVTFHGYMGWGIGMYFESVPLTLAEAFYMNNVALVNDLESRFPEKAGVNLDSYGRRSINDMARKYGINDGTLLGHLWDRDTVAFYGDPAWIAKMPAEYSNFSWSLDSRAESYTVTVKVLKDCNWARPFIVPLPHRIENIKLGDHNADLPPVFADNFVLIPFSNETLKAGRVITIKFGAKKRESYSTSADSKPVIVSEKVSSEPAHPSSVKHALMSPVDYGMDVYMALRAAGGNAGELIAALADAAPDKEKLKGMTFLIENMPLVDLKSLSKDFLTGNLDYALKARSEMSWCKELPEEMFLEYVLPYASLNEERDDWRGDFYKRFAPLVSDCSTAGEAAIVLNTKIYDLLNVHYHATKRPKADQSPSESIKAGYASCTGLSILLVDACRAVGVPARIAGVAQWTGSKGNHTWVEVWDGKWFPVGASESNSLGDVWFAEAAARADASDPMKCIYASSFKRRPLRFPLVWNRYIDYVSAQDVTASYKKTD